MLHNLTLIINSPLEQFEVSSLISIAPIFGYINITLTIESIFTTINTMVREQLGKEIYLPFIYSLFFFILIIIIGLSFTILTGVTILGLYLHKLHFFSYFVPSGTPLALVPLLVLIETVSYLARALSLAGHSLLKILSTFLYQMFNSSFIIAIFTLIPFAFFLALSYVFVLLVISYIKDAIYLH
ncbi:ATP synthase subunit 6 [Lactarius sanguifluus]|nr:ATP synthase subunit 6 [Lactarius sanguifluus]